MFDQNENIFLGIYYKLTCCFKKFSIKKNIVTRECNINVICIYNNKM